jgi:hypothetical protein
MSGGNKETVGIPVFLQRSKREIEFDPAKAGLEMHHPVGEARKVWVRF